MRRLLTLASMSVCILGVNAQKSNVTATYFALQDGDLKGAKQAIDEAVVHEVTAVESKTWYYYAETYVRILHKSLDTTSQGITLDPESADKAWAGYQKAMELDPEMKFTRVDAQMMNWVGIQRGLDFLQRWYQNRGQVLVYDSAAYNSAQVHFKQAEVIEDVRKAKFGATSDTILVYFRGLTSELVGDTSEALRYYERLLPMGWKQPAFYVRVADLYMTLDRPDDALRALAAGESVMHHPDFTVSKLNIYILTRQLEARLNEFEAAVAEDPSNTDLVYALGVIYNNLYDSAVSTKQANAPEYRTKALATYGKVLVVDSNHFNATYNTGVLYYNDAVRVGEEMNALPVEGDGAAEEYKRLKGVREGLLRQGLPFLQKALRLKPEDDKARLALRQTYVLLDMRQEAALLK